MKLSPVLLATMLASTIVGCNDKPIDTIELSDKKNTNNLIKNDTDKIKNELKLDIDSLLMYDCQTCGMG